MKTICWSAIVDLARRRTGIGVNFDPATAARRADVVMLPMEDRGASRAMIDDIPMQKNESRCA